MRPIVHARLAHACSIVIRAARGYANILFLKEVRDLMRRCDAFLWSTRMASDLFEVTENDGGCRLQSHQRDQPRASRVYFREHVP